MRLKENQMSLGKRIQPKLLLLGAGRDFMLMSLEYVSSGRHPLTIFWGGKKGWKSSGPESSRRKSSS